MASTADRYGDSDMAERGCNFCSSDAKTERTRVTSFMVLALCQRCATVWDTATTAEEDRAVAEAETNQEASGEQAQLTTLFEAIRYLVTNTLPEALSDREYQTQLLDDLDEIISSGTE